MDDPTSSHLAWSKAAVPRHRYNLADSAIATPDLTALGLPDRAGIPSEGYELQGTLERALGARLDAPGGRVLISAGASEANACVFLGLLQHGDEVLVETPGYQPHMRAAQQLGLAVRRFERPLGGGVGLATAVETALGPATRLVVVSDLHNPSGAALTREEARALAAVAERHGIWVMCDETFREADAGRPPGTAASLSPRLISTSSLTKSFGLGALRIGWIAGREEVLTRCEGAQNALSVQPALPSVALALALVPHFGALRQRAHRILETNHARWRARTAASAPFAVPVAPSGTTAWCVFSGARDGDVIATLASREFDLAIPPGEFFGDGRGIRVGLGADPEAFARALDVFERCLAKFVAIHPGRPSATPTPATIQESN